jgi:hypothetical protein
LFAIFVPGPTTRGIEVITKLDVAYQAPQYLQPLLAFMPEVSEMKLHVNTVLWDVQGRFALTQISLVASTQGTDPHGNLTWIYTPQQPQCYMSVETGLLSEKHFLGKVYFLGMMQFRFGKRFSGF